MSSLFDGDEHATRDEQPKPPGENQKDAFESNVVLDLELGLLQSALMGFVLATGYFWLGFPLTLGAEAFGLISNPAVTNAWTLWVTTALIGFAGFLIAESVRLVRRFV